MEKRIILVDDDQDFCEILKSRLEKEGFTVEVAYDGEQGLKKVKSNPPDLLILDVMMPKKSGLEVCKELKADSAYKEIPIIMLTAVAEQMGETTYTQYDAMSMEAEDYIPKGPDCTEKVVKSVLEIISKE